MRPTAPVEILFFIVLFRTYFAGLHAAVKFALSRNKLVDSSFHFVFLSSERAIGLLEEHKFVDHFVHFEAQFFYFFILSPNLVFVASSNSIIALLNAHFVIEQVFGILSEDVAFVKGCRNLLLNFSNFGYMVISELL